jgi:hypothetical protein
MKKLLLLLLAVTFLCGCRTTTRTKATAESETVAKETAKEETERQTVDSIAVSKVEEVLRDQNITRTETHDEVVTTITTMTTREVFPDFREVPGTGMHINDRTGRTIDTKVIIEETRKINRQLLEQQTLKEQQRRSEDSIATIKTLERAAKEAALEVYERMKTDNREVVKEGWQPGFWFWFWVVLVVVISITGILLRKKLKKMINPLS